jgi:curved DNA-binding protein CbpA
VEDARPRSGSRIEEIRRAYRRLAKVNHPDAAGEAALPRFLAIQAAYEQLVAPSARRRPGSRPARSSPTPPEPWRADPDRARAAGRADGRRPGTRPTGRPGNGAEQADPDRGRARGGRGAEWHGRRRRCRRGRCRRRGGGASARSRRPSGRRRAPNKATPYSTSYDPGDEEPFEPGWSGASWYGSSSGTYWTINPKEYADPRKHGPEYLRRARRGANGWILDDDETPAGHRAEPDPVAPAGGQAEGPESTWTDAAAGSPPDGREAADDGGIGGQRARAGAPASACGHGRRTPGRPSSEPPRLVRRAAAGAPLPRAHPPPADDRPRPAGDRAARLAAARPRDDRRDRRGDRLRRFAASCGELSSPGTWIVQAAILLLLLALPRVAAWLAHGTLATALIGIPTAIILSAGGGSRVPEASAGFLTTVLAIAWIAGSRTP